MQHMIRNFIIFLTIYFSLVRALLKSNQENYKQGIGESNVVFHDNNSCMSRNYKSEELQEEGT